MAHTDACKFQVCQFVEKCVQNGMTVNEASKHAQVESDGIPAKTIQRWWRDIQRATSEELPNNEQPTPTIGDCCGKVVANGCKVTPEKIVEKVDALVEKGLSTREAAKEVAKSLDKRPASVRSTYCREKEKTAYQGEASEAWQFADIAIMQLSRIRIDDPGREEAFQRVIDWITEHKEG